MRQKEVIVARIGSKPEKAMHSIYEEGHGILKTSSQ